jgi:hypothetical protein
MQALHPHLHGPHLGWIVEAKVLKGRFGAVDIVLPAVNLLVQVDGHQHKLPKQMEKDAAFDAESIKQKHVLLRLWHEDMDSWQYALGTAFQKCICIACCGHACPGLVVYTHKHPQVNKPMQSVTL